MPTPQRDFSPFHARHILSLEPSHASILETTAFSKDDIFALFAQALKFEEAQARNGCFLTPAKRRVIAFLFFEPSTRTRMSFQVAAERMGYRTLTLESAASSSLSKGETLFDTVLNVLAMQPDGIVVRYGADAELDHWLPRLSIPVFSAGTGARSHPSQGLLDSFTIYRERGTVAGVKVLINGDIRHSRVAASNFDVLLKLGANVAVCGPADWLPIKSERLNGVQVFEDLDDACAWCDVYMGLRIQRERHESEALDLRAYNNEFGLNRSRLSMLKKDAMILHPGPINHGVEFSEDVFHDPRNRVLNQVSNGVLIRAALLARAFEGA